MTELTRNELTDGLRALGLASGDSVVVHSSCRRMNPVEGGAETVISALLDAVGPDGNLMFPTFTYSNRPPDFCFDPAETPCRTGIIPELGRRREGAIRSPHPTHSVAVIGPDAEALTGDHLNSRAVGVGSPIDRLAQRGGKVLLMAVGHRANSMIHVAEDRAGMAKVSPRDPQPSFKVRWPDGRTVSHPLDNSVSCSAGFDAAELSLRREGAIRDTTVGGPLQLMAGLDVIHIIRDLLQRRPDALLCHRDECAGCRLTRKRLRDSGRL